MTWISYIGRFLVFKTFQCSNCFESWSNLLSCLRRRFYSIISFDLVMRNLNFRISEFQSCFSKASGIWAILQSRGRSWKNMWYFSVKVITSNLRKILREFREEILSLFDGEEVVWRKSHEFDVFGSINRSILVLFCKSSDCKYMHLVCRMKNREKHYQRIIEANKIRLSSPRVLCSAKTSPNKRRLLH